MRKNIKLRVKNLVNKYQTADPFALAKELDVNILYVPLPEKIRGILVRVLRKKTILLNDKLNPDLTIDDLHLNGAGYRILVYTLRDLFLTDR